MKKTSRLLVDIFLIITILLCILPFLYMILMSLKSTVNAYDFDFALSKLTLKHYKNIFTNSTFIRYFFNSVFVAISGVLLTLFTSCTAGFAFAKLKFRGNDKLFFLLILSMLVPSGLCARTACRTPRVWIFWHMRPWPGNTLPWADLWLAHTPWARRRAETGRRNEAAGCRKFRCRHSG